MAASDAVVKFLVNQKGASVVNFKQGHLSWFQKAHSFSIASEMTFGHRKDYWGLGGTLEPNSDLVAGNFSTISI